MNFSVSKRGKPILIYDEYIYNFLTEKMGKNYIDAKHVSVRAV